MVDLVEAGRDVTFKHPGVTVGCEHVDLGDGVVCSASRTEAVAARLEVRLEDRLEDQLEAGLHYPVSGGRDAQVPELARSLGDHPLPHGQRHKPPSLEIVSQHGEDSGRRKDDVAWFHAIDSGRARASIAPHASPRDREEGGIAHEVVQVTELTIGAVSCPSVQLGLDPQYPGLGFFERRP